MRLPNDCYNGCSYNERILFYLACHTFYFRMTDWKRGKKPEEIIPFVDGWDFVDILGEGAFGEVRLVVNSAHNIAAATKIVNLDKLSEDTIAAIEKEVKLHKFLHHKNIIRYYR